jgi:N-acyl-D-aspartate/D-glutamate deacylase
LTVLKEDPISQYTLVIRNGMIYDGTRSAPIRADLGIRDGRVATVGSIEAGAATREIDALGKWVIPGMIDVHTHYDAEVLGSPGLGESVRHGVTSVVLGNCSLSTVYSDADDCADMFARVEALPWDAVHEAEGKRGRIHQSTPNLAVRSEIARYFLQSMGRKRKPLKTTLISAVDAKSDRTVVRMAIAAAHVVNRLGGDGFRWQHLPVPFEVYADGIDVVVFEQFGSGAAALNVRDVMKRGELLADEDYRRTFRKEMTKKFGFKVWNRDLHDAEIVACPDASVIGKSFGDVAESRGIEPCDALLDLAVEHGTALRWRTTIANDRDDVLDRIQRSKAVQIGFADSGAHLRNMAFYNFGVRMLERVHTRKFMPIEAAVHRLTGELADWYGLDAGRLTIGSRADVVVIDPAGFDGCSADYAEAPVPGLDGLNRMVNRNDGAVAATIVGGHLLYEYGTFAEGFGTTIHAGEFLQAKDGQ